MNADVLVRPLETPNPYAIKFVVNKPVLNQGKLTISNPVECENLPLVASLFDILGVKQVYLFQNQITVSHEGDLLTDEFIDQAVSVIQSRFAIHNANYIEESDKAPVDRSQLSKELREVEEILDRTIRPGLQADGGDLEVLSYKDNLIKIMYQGACGGCPSAMMGTLDAIEGILQNELKNPELKVRPI